MNKHDYKRRPWTVEFAFRFNNDYQRHAIRDLGPLAYGVVRAWLSAVMPAAVVLEPQDMPIRRVVCPSRESARRLIKTFGGHIAQQ